MKLYIDTKNSEKIVVGFDNKRIEAYSRQEKSQQLLKLIVQNLGRRGRGFADIKGIEINLGSGSFTGLRVGVSVANALAWSLDIPINGKRQLVAPLY